MTREGPPPGVGAVLRAMVDSQLDILVQLILLQYANDFGEQYIKIAREVYLRRRR